MFLPLSLLIFRIHSISAANVTVDDSNPGWTYSQYWNFIADGPCNGCAYQIDTNQTYNRTWHETSAPQASASISFDGTAFEVYGLCGLWPANYTLILDGAYNGTYLNPGCPQTAFQYNLLIYSGKNIPPTTHTVELINQEYQFQYGGKEYASDLVIDYLVYNGVASPSPTASHLPTTSTSNPSPQRSSVPLAKVIAPIAVIAVVIGILAFWLGRRYSRGRTGTVGQGNASFTTDRPPQTPTQQISQEILSTRVTPMTESEGGVMRYKPQIQSPQRAAQLPSTDPSLLESGVGTSRKSPTSAEGGSLDYHSQSSNVHTSMSEGRLSSLLPIPSSSLSTHTLPVAEPRPHSPGLADAPPSYGDVIQYLQH